MPERSTVRQNVFNIENCWARSRFPDVALACLILTSVRVHYLGLDLLRIEGLGRVVSYVKPISNNAETIALMSAR